MGRIFRHFKLKGLFAIFLLVSGISIVTILVCSFEQIDFNEYGLKQNIWTREISEEIYEEGFYYIDPFHTFLRFQSTWQTIEFTPDFSSDDIPLSTQTKDGLEVTVDVSFQFRLRKQDLLELYSSYGMDYRDYFIRVARSALREVCGEFSAIEFYATRSKVNLAMKTSLNDSLASLMDVGEFQLRDIDLPDSFEAATEELEVARIQIQIEQYAQEAAIIEAQTLIFQAQADANITIIDAQAAADALDITLTAEGILLSELATAVGLNSTELLTYLWIQAILEHDSSYLIIGENTPILWEL